MTTKTEYAILAAQVYADARGDDNKSPIPPGWEKIANPSDMSHNPFSGGFTAAAYKRGAEIVIAFKGTDFLIGSDAQSNNGQTFSDLLTDAGLGGGFGSSQLAAAALFYEQIKKDNPGATISFTGHSLGAGLASIMSVWFDRKATVFAEAPFKLTALSGEIASNVLADLSKKGFSAPELAEIIHVTPTNDDLGTALSVDYGPRASNLTNYFVKGELLESMRANVPTIQGVDMPIQIGGGETLPGTTLHSIVLHAALLLEDKFRKGTIALPSLLPLIFDKKLYFVDGRYDTPDFLTKLLNDRIGFEGGNSSQSTITLRRRPRIPYQGRSRPEQRTSEQGSNHDRHGVLLLHAEREHERVLQ